MLESPVPFAWRPSFAAALSVSGLRFVKWGQPWHLQDIQSRPKPAQPIDIRQEWVRTLLHLRQHIVDHATQVLEP